MYFYTGNKIYNIIFYLFFYLFKELVNTVGDSHTISMWNLKLNKYETFLNYVFFTITFNSSSNVTKLSVTFQTIFIFLTLDLCGLYVEEWILTKIEP